MAQIPTLPTNEPVFKPDAKAGLFGMADEAVAGLGQESEQLSQEATAFSGQLQFAHRQLQAKEAEIAIDRYMNGVYADLNKQTTIEGVDSVLHNAQDPNNVGNLLAPYDKDHKLGQMVHLAWQQAQVGLENQVNIHKAHLITEGTKAADAVNEAKTTGQAVTVANAGADDDTVGVFRERYHQGLLAGQHAGVYTPQEVDAKMYQWDQTYMKSLAKAGMDSPDPSIRKRTMTELKSSGGHFGGLDQTTRNGLYDEAVERNERLTNMEQTADLDAAEAHFNQLTQGWPYEAKVKALNDDKWATSNGFADDNGNPRRKVLDKIGEDVDRQELRTRKIQTDKDNDIINKYMVDVDKGKMSDTQIDKAVLAEGGSKMAANQLKSSRREILKQELELGSLSLQMQALKRQQWQDQSYEQLGKIQNDIQNGIRHSDEEINGMLGRGIGKMSSQQVSEALRLSHAYETDPVNKPFYKTIAEQQFEPGVQGEVISEFDKYVHDHPNATSIEKSKAVLEIVHPSNIKRINEALDKAGDVFAKPGRGTVQQSRPPNAIGTQMFSDGKRHYVGKDGVDLGVAQ